ncbi:MAG TPA: YbbR-like domain-containing protein [Gemmatimonadaceae bacterium]|nr:YbbR-like domain-containing protein [Gemmatimonadaceae bacterium]
MAPPTSPASGTPPDRPQLGARARTLEHRLAAMVTARFPLKLAALFFALVLWLAVSAEEPTEEWVDVRVALVHDSSVTLVDSVPPVQALVVGRGRDLLKLYTTLPVLRRVIDSDTAARLTLSLRPGDVDLPSNVDARVRDVRPSAMSLRVRITESRRVPVRSAIELTPDSGFHVLGLPNVDPDSVEVRGSREAVRKLSAVYTERRQVDVHDTLTDVVVPVDTAGLRMRVSPPQVRIRILGARDAVPRPSSP